MVRLHWMLVFFSVTVVAPPSILSASEQVDVIIQTEGSTQNLVDAIRAQGGTVRFRYQNVDAVAASIPQDRLAAISRLAGVTLVEKDRMVSLPDPEHEGRPLAYEVLGTDDVGVLSLPLSRIDPRALPRGYANFALTGAVDVWEKTAFGEGSIVAVVDSGTVPNECLAHAVIGAPGFPQGYNATDDGIPATDPSNRSHGTIVGGVIASLCGLDFSADPTNPLYRAIAAHLPWAPDFVPILGQAPGAQLYPVKVFSRTGSAPTSVILDGLDHVISLKRDGLLDIDIVNMSLGGATLFDGLDTFDRFVLRLWRENIVVVAAAGNDGPIPNTIGSPATAYNAISVGALDYAVSSRVLYEYLGLVWLGVPGQGLVMRPDDATRVANFSSRGPLSDGRAGPDLAALGMWNFHAGPTNDLSWSSGTSFATPTVVGAAALLNAYWEARTRRDTSPYAIHGALVRGADAKAVGAPWRRLDDMGRGALDVPAALARLERRDYWFNPFVWVGPLQPNTLPPPEPGRTDVYESGTVAVRGGEMNDYTVAVDATTSRVVVEISKMVADDNGEYAVWPNALELHIQSAKRTSMGRPVASLWYPQYSGDTVTYVIEDGPWFEVSAAGEVVLADQPMEPGVLKITVGADYSNETPVSYEVRVTREGERTPPQHLVARQLIRQDEWALLPVTIPEGVTKAVFDLAWFYDWSRFPTNYIYMLIFGPDGGLVTWATAFNAPERAVVEEPAPGVWTVEVVGYEVYLPDVFSLYLTTE